MREQVRECLTGTSPHVRVSGFRNLENFCLWNPESRALESKTELKYPTKEWNLESKFHWKRLEFSTRNPESMEWNPESKTVFYSLTWGDSTGLWTANDNFSFIYLPLIKSPHLKTFVKEISVRRFLPFSDGFYLLRVVSFFFTLQETVRSPRLLVYRSQLIKTLAHANNKVSSLISNRAISVKVRRK